MSKTDSERVKECLAFVENNPQLNFPTYWLDMLEKEAMELGLIPEFKRMGINCPREQFFEPLYGGDMADVF